jgi:hypothetical protein
MNIKYNYYIHPHSAFPYGHPSPIGTHPWKRPIKSFWTSELYHLNLDHSLRIADIFDKRFPFWQKYGLEGELLEVLFLHYIALSPLYLPSRVTKN